MTRVPATTIVVGDIIVPLWRPRHQAIRVKRIEYLTGSEAGQGWAAHDRVIRFIEHEDDYWCQMLVSADVLKRTPDPHTH